MPTKNLLLTVGLCLLSTVALPAEWIEIERVSVSNTGEVRPITWCSSDDQTTSNWEHTIQVFEFPPAEGQVPVAEQVFFGNTSRWDWVPASAGVYWLRARSCNLNVPENDLTRCSPWGSTVDVQDAIPGCSTTPTRSIIYIKLAPPTGGGLDG